LGCIALCACCHAFSGDAKPLLILNEDDSVNGHPFRYHRLPGRTYHLYSIGLDGKDDGGQAPPTLPNRGVDYTRGDWVRPGSPR
jgi:hypothetical protein